MSVWVPIILVELVVMSFLTLVSFCLVGSRLVRLEKRLEEIRAAHLRLDGRFTEVQRRKFL